ncbi:MAG: M15 family metallopeptidase [Sinobacteraceae bacterium]|nr:M15 family metallopeptidase [Nevskiaceae bacterium]
MSRGLGEAQRQFAQMVALLIQQADLMGYEVTLGDAYRDPRVFGQIGERRGYGESRSAHKQRLAIDLNLFRNGEYLRKTEDHRPLGVWWESQGGTWGGRWNDGNHYSLTYNGIA